MRIKDEYVSINQAEKIFEVITQSLSETKDIQIVIEKDLIEELQNNGAKHNVYTFNGTNCPHYNANGNGCSKEIWLARRMPNSIISASFIAICKGHYLLVSFPNGNVSTEYLHYLVGCEKLLMIKVDM